MPDFDPNDMDALFREGAERHEFEYNPDAWALMEEKLDKKDNKRRILFYLLGLVILLGSVISYAYLNINEVDKKDATIATHTIDPKDNLEEVLTIEEELDNKSEIVTTNEISQESKETYISTDSKESSSNIGAQNSFQSESTGNLIGNEIVSTDSQIESVQRDYQVQKEVELKPFITREKESTSIAETSQEPLEYISFPGLVSRNFGLIGKDENILNSIYLEPSSTQHTPIVLPSNNRFALTIFANPEWSSVGLFQESKAGWSFGTRLGYQFADKFEVSAGLAFSRKIYKGSGAEYTMEGGWIYDKEPVQMDAKCDVIEIPLGLSYYVNGFRNSGFFADLGISSYMLHSEWYGFAYDDLLVRPERYVDVVAEDENKHLVGVGRIALGYQKILSNNTSLQVAPYLQFPLTGIGAGQVNLYSSGVQVAVKFNTQ